MAFRTDSGTLSGVQRTPQGGIRVDAALTRTGLLRYRNPDGSDRWELRRPEDVFHATSLAGLRDAPVTDEHHGLVTAANHSALAKGHVSGEPRQDGDTLAATLVIQDADLIAAIEAGTKREVSAGYECDLETAPGEHAGQRYDAVQRNIRYNHIAIVPRGRAGSGVCLRLDAAGDEVHMAIVRVEDVEYEDGGQAHKAIVAALARANRAEGEVTALRSRADAAEQTAQALRAAEESRKEQALRAELLPQVIACMGWGYTGEGKSARQLKEDAIGKRTGASDLAQRSADYIDGCYAALSVRQDASPLADAAGAVPSGGVGIIVHTPPAGSVTALPATGVINTALPAWQRPLAVSRDRLRK